MSLHRMTPFLEFMLRWGTTFIGQFASTVERSKQSEWLFLDTSIMRSPDLSLLTDAGVPAKPLSPYSMAKGFRIPSSPPTGRNPRQTYSGPILNPGPAGEHCRYRAGY